MQEMVAAANLILAPFKCLCPIICAVEIGEETRAEILHPVASRSRECPVLTALRISGVCVLYRGFI